MTTKMYKEWLKSTTIKQQDERWNFKKFGIVCNKCQSCNVEINGECEIETGYYDDALMDFELLVKCHTCGAAMYIRKEEDDEFSFGNTLPKEESI